jgi:hypothetical protein
MQKSIRSFALVVTLALAAVPAVRADQTGCNPHPQVASVSATSSFVIVVYTVIGLLGA